MAASATNTSREIGAVTGVAVLGALVNSQLRSDLTGRLQHLGIPANFQSIVIHAIETGGVPSSGNTSGAGGAAGPARASWSRRSSTPPIRPSTKACGRPCSCRPGWCSPPGSFPR